jgi:hypothetical protein
MKFIKLLRLFTLSTALSVLSVGAVLNSFNTSVSTEKVNADQINVFTLLNGKTLSGTFTTAPSIPTLIRVIVKDYPTLAPYTNQLEFGTQTSNTIQVKAYAWAPNLIGSTYATVNFNTSTPVLTNLTTIFNTDAKRQITDDTNTT